MPLQAERNLYPGINPHLNSLLQTTGGGWESFHAKYIIALSDELDRHLPAGYYTMPEKSLQISELGSSVSGKIRPDITVYESRPHPHRSAGLSPSAALPTATFPIPETLEEEDYLTGLVIYRLEQGEIPGTPVTRIEVLSPPNKPPNPYHRQYLVRRIDTLQAGLRLVEIDFLHETRPHIRQLASYPDRHAEAYPYTVIVSDPHPTLDEGTTQVYGFHVDDPLPNVPIPLANTDGITLDFGASYQLTFANWRFCQVVVDYSQSPARFETYTAADQTRIQQRMATIAQQLKS